MARSPLLGFYPLIAGVLFLVGAVRFYMRLDFTGVIINLIAAALSFAVASFYLRARPQ
jgi:hypothetical protein